MFSYSDFRDKSYFPRGSNSLAGERIETLWEYQSSRICTGNSRSDGA
jgi:hypothetical protein